MQVIEVEVDTWLGHVRVLNVHTGIAVGRSPALAHSQATGSVIRASATRSTKRAKPIRAAAIFTAGGDYGFPALPTFRNRRAFRRRRI